MERRNGDKLRINDCFLCDETNEYKKGIFTFHKVFEGIVLRFDEINTADCWEVEFERGNILEINHCRKGQFRCQRPDGSFIRVGPGDFSMQYFTNENTDAVFPSSYYSGLTILVDLDKAPESLLEEWSGTRIGLSEVFNRLCSKDKPFIIRSTESIQHIFSELYSVPESIKLAYMRVKVIELFLFLSFVNAEGNMWEREYFEKISFEQTRDVHNYMVQNLERRFTQEELSDKFNISLTCLKKCFKELYGNSIYAYAKQYRMIEASKLLRETNKSITEIGLILGYKNSSKFSIAFKDVMNITPSEYRKMKTKRVKQD